MSLEENAATCLRVLQEENVREARELLPALYQLLNERPAVRLVDIYPAWVYRQEEGERPAVRLYRQAETGGVLETACLLSAKRGLLDVIKELITNYNCDPQCRDWWGNTSLHLSVQGGHLDIAKYLINEQNVAIQNIGAKLIRAAARGGHLDIIKYLINEQNVAIQNIGTELVFEAAKEGHLDIIKYLINEQNVAIQHIGTELVRAAARWGCLYIVKYLIEEQHCSPVDGGYHALHGACAFGHVPVVEYLLSTGKVDPHARNVFGETAMNRAKKYGGQEALRVCQEFTRVKAAFPVQDFVKGLLLGHPSAGKSTLAKTFQQRASSLLPPILGQFRNVSGVEAHTAGIIPIQLHSKELGHMMLYDFAGQPEYYASHTAVLHNLLQGTPAVFLCVVDMSESEERVLREVHYWLSFIENEASGVLSRSQVIVVGSHADVAREKGQDLERKCREMTQVGEEHLGRGVFSGIMTLDCRKLGGEDLSSLLSVLGRACHAVREDSRADISWYCHMLLSFLQEKVTAVACTIGELSSHICSSKAYLPQEADELCGLLSVLNERGLVLLLKNKMAVSSSWVIVRKQSLLSEVNGILFAPDDFKEHHSLASNTGIIPLSVLENVFPQYDPSMLSGFLKSLEFCQEIDPSTLEVVSSNLVSSSPSSSTAATSSEPLLFFPALVKLEHPEEFTRQQDSSSFGWLLSCVKKHQFLSPRFINILLLRLAYTFALATLPADGESLSEHLSRRCHVWKNGLHWLNEYGLECLVEVWEQGQSVVVMVSQRQGQEVAYAELCSSLVGKVLAIQKEVCPSVELQESLVLPFQLQQYPWDKISTLALFDIREVARAVVEQKPCVVDRKGNKLLQVANVLSVEPYQVLRASCMKELFDSSKAEQPVPPGLLREVQRQCGQLLSHCRACQVSSGVSHQSLRSLLDKFSVFAGRNPLELAGTSGAADSSSSDPYTESSVPLDTLDSSSLRKLLPALHQLVDWKVLGLELGLLHSTLQVIEDEQRGRVRMCTTEMLSGWLEWRDLVRECGTPSWRRLVDALRIVGEDRVAEEVVRTAPWNK